MPALPWYVWALLAAFVVACSSVAEKRILTKAHATQFAASLAIMSAVVSAPFLPFIGWSDLSPSILLTIYGGSILGSLGFLIVAKAIRHIELGEVTVFLLSSPALVAVFAYIALGESLSPLDVGGLLLAILGMVVLEWRAIRAFLGSSLAPEKAHYLLLAILATILYSASVLVDRRVLSTFPVNAIEYTVLVQFMIAINMVLFSRLHYGGFAQMLEGIRAHWKALGMVAILLSIARMFYGQAIALAYVALVAVVKRSAAAVFTNVFSHFLLNEDGFGRKMAATGIIIAGIALVTLK